MYIEAKSSSLFFFSLFLSYYMCFTRLLFIITHLQPPLYLLLLCYFTSFCLRDIIIVCDVKTKKCNIKQAERGGDPMLGRLFRPADEEPYGPGRLPRVPQVRVQRGEHPLLASVRRPQEG